jgi:DNA recombination protein RmuC
MAMDLLFLVTGLIIGSIFTWLIARYKFLSLSQIDVAAFQELDKQKAMLQQQLEDAKVNFDKTSSDLSENRNNSVLLEKEAVKWKTNYDNLEQKLKEQKVELEQLHMQMKDQFNLIATEIVFKNSQRIQEEHREKLGDILAPLKDKIEKFENQVRTTNEERIKEHHSMKEQLTQLQTLNKSIGDEAKNLVSALKGQTKTQGNWGEMILEKVLERSGLAKGREYFVQSSMTNEEGRRLQPDVVISLPEGRSIVIDAKVSLIAYERYSSIEEITLREQALKEHIGSIKKHVKDLSSKNYQNLYQINTLDFVLLFVPIEPAFALAVENDPELFNDAFDKNIVIVTTSTLLATLRTIASIWRLENQNKNSLEIARQAGDLYDKFSGLVDDLIGVGKKISDAQLSYESTMNKLVQGRGNLVSRVENLKKLGVKSTKQINQKVLDRTEDLNVDNEFVEQP